MVVYLKEKSLMNALDFLLNFAEIQDIPDAHQILTVLLNKLIYLLLLLLLLSSS
jgi:hypothetical protein